MSQLMSKLARQPIIQTTVDLSPQPRYAEGLGGRLSAFISKNTQT